MRQPFLEAEVGEVVAARLQPEERAQFLVHLDEGVAGIHPHDLVAMVHLLQGGLPLAAQLARQSPAEDLRDLVRGAVRQAHLAGALEQLADREVPAEDQVAAVLDLVHGVEAAQVDRRALARGKLRPQLKHPPLQPLVEDAR